jgi:hypothetical protein
MNEDIHATGTDIGVAHAELVDPISSHLPWTPAPKHIHLGTSGQVKPIIFIPTAVKAMLSSHACISFSASPRVLILNNSFQMMSNYKAKHKKFPSTYDDIVVF